MNSLTSLKNYATITGAYWGFTLTDGAIRMLIVLYFYQLGYSPLTIASLFLFYEFFGIITNLLGGWIGSRFGLNTTLYSGMLLQIGALLMLTVDTQYLTVAYVMLAQAISGIAKDLNKMSAKSSVKLMAPSSDDEVESANRLFKWVAVLTGSKNTLKGAGFFLGGFLLTMLEFQGALYFLSGMLATVFIITLLILPAKLGKSSSKAKFKQLFSNTPNINWLSLARFFLFSSRDVWFVVGLPLYLTSVIGWSFSEVGGFMAIWIIFYGLVQAFSPRLLQRFHQGRGPDEKTAIGVLAILLFVPLLIALFVHLEFRPEPVIIAGLMIFAVVFALNSALHSYLIVAWSDRDKVAMNVGFYYMANAGGRLMGTLLSGLAYQFYGLTACLVISAIFILCALIASFKLRRVIDI